MAGRYTTRDVEVERDEFVDAIRKELDQDVRHHFGIRRRCECRRYLDDLNAHPSGSGRNCRKDRLVGQVWIDSVSEERDAYSKLLNDLREFGRIRAKVNDLEVQLDWYRDFENGIREGWHGVEERNKVLMECLSSMTDGINEFVTGPKSDDKVSDLGNLATSVIEMMKDLKVTKTDDVGDKENEGDCDDWNTDWDETEDENDDADDKNDCSWSRHDTSYSEGANEDNTGPPDVDGLGGVTGDSSGAVLGDNEEKGEGSQTGQDPPPPALHASGGDVAASFLNSLGPGAIPKQTVKDPKVRFKGPDEEVIDPSLRHRGLLATIKGDKPADKRKPVLPTVSIGQNNRPFIVSGGMSNSSTAAAGGGRPPTASVGSTTTVLGTPPAGYEFPGLNEKSVPLCHQTNGSLCGGSPDNQAMKYLTKVVTMTISKTDTAEQWIDKWSQLYLMMKVHCGSESIYTLLALWVKLTPTLYRHYSEMLEKVAYFTSFQHFVREFAASNYPSLKTVALSKLTNCRQKENQTVREYRLDFTELVKMCDRRLDDYTYEFYCGLKSDRHKSVLQSKDWGAEGMTIDGITNHIAGMEDISRVRNALDKRGATVASSDRSRDVRSVSVAAMGHGATGRGAISYGTERGRGIARGRPATRAVGPWRGRGAGFRSASRGGGVPLGVRSVSADASVASFNRGGFGRGRGMSRGQAGVGSSQGRGSSYAGQRGPSLPERISIMNSRRQQLSLNGGKPSCPACFSPGHKFPDTYFSQCSSRCYFCNELISIAKHGHLECLQRPRVGHRIRQAVLAHLPILNSLNL